MPAPASIEDAPHHLKLLNDYAKGVVTLALGLLTLTVAFSEKLLKSPGDDAQAWLLGGLWVALFLAIACGLLIIGHVNAVSYFYMKAFRIGYPDALALLSKGEKVKPDAAGQEVQITDTQQLNDMKAALNDAKSRAAYAYSWATRSLFTLGLSALLLSVLGVYAGIYRGHSVDPASAADAARAFVSGQYNIPPNATYLKSLALDERANAYALELRNRQAPGEEYKVTVSIASGRVIHAAKSP